MYDLVIIGGGPGGVAAGIYAERKKIKTLLITDSFGGQSVVSSDIKNWVGTKSVSGYDLAQMLEGHLRDRDDIDIVQNDRIEKIEKMSGGFKLTSKEGKTFETKYILVTTGSHHKKLGIPGEKEFDGKGVVYCSTCDAPLFGGKAVAVVGGGNAGLEAVTDLLAYATEIYLLIRSEVLKGDPITQDIVKNSPKVKILFNAVSQEVIGKEFVTGLKYQDKTGEGKMLPVEGVFVEIGSLPNSDIVKGLVNLNDRGEIVVDHKTQQTSDPSIWAVGDVTDVLYKQNNISAGDAVKATLNIYDRLRKG